MRPHLVSDLTNDVLIKKKLFAALFNKGLQLSWTIHRKFLKLGQGKEEQGNGSIEIIIQRNFSTVIQWKHEVSWKRKWFFLWVYISHNIFEHVKETWWNHLAELHYCPTTQCILSFLLMLKVLNYFGISLGNLIQDSSIITKKWFPFS